MIQESEISKILFLDVETVPQYESYLDLPDTIRELWSHKAKFISKQTPLQAYKRAGIYAEFGKIVCISIGYIQTKKGEKFMRLKSFFHKDEAKLLQAFRDVLVDFENKADTYLCAHNGKEFDFPYIGRRMIVNGVDLPQSLRLHGKKPWEVHHLDTMELWRFGDYKQFTSLKLLCEILKIPTPKDEMDGSQVAGYYYGGKINEIVRYCQKDVVATANLLMRYMNHGLLQDKNISIIKT